MKSSTAANVKIFLDIGITRRCISAPVVFLKYKFRNREAEHENLMRWALKSHETLGHSGDPALSNGYVSILLHALDGRTQAIGEGEKRALQKAQGGRANTDRPIGAASDAIILAAGRGRRLGEVTRDRPKCLTELAGRTLLQHQLELLKAAGIERVCAVAGYQAQTVQQAAYPAAEVIYNDLWASTDSLYSLWLCRNWVRGPVIVMNCDVVVHPEGIRRLLDVRGNAFIYDSRSGADPEHMKVELKAGRLIAMSKNLPADRVCGENVGVLQFDQGAFSFLVREAEAALRLFGKKSWQAAIALERLCQFIPIQGVDISHLPWIEIDFPEDLDIARRETWPAISLLPPRLAAASRSAVGIAQGVA